jgi:hypothetical protein
VIVTVLEVDVEDNKRSLYMDTELHYQLTHYVVPSVYKKDFDYLILIDGDEGVGKSVFGMQIAKILDPNFSISNVCYSPEEFVHAIKNSKKHSCILFDEAFTGLSGRSTLSQTNQLLINNMMQMRQKNLFVIIILPSFFMLDRYCVLVRGRGLFHVHLNEDGRRGYWVYFDKKKMKDLWLFGKKGYDYNKVHYRLEGVFRDQYMVNEKSYRKKKNDAFEKEKLILADTRNKYLLQRNVLLYLLNKKLSITQTKIAKLCNKVGFKIDHATISKIIIGFEREHNKTSNFSKDNGVIEETGT